MNAQDLRAARLARDWSQVKAAVRLTVSQPSLAMLERGQRRLAPRLAQRAAKFYNLPPAAVPPSPRGVRPRCSAATLARDRAGLRYPGFAYVRSRSWTPKNSSEVLLNAVAQDDLEPRLVEALPWLVLRYWTLDWGWAVRQAKLRDLQNRLGFVVGLTHRLAERAGDTRKGSTLTHVEAELDHSRLARADTLCRASLPEPERRWLTEHRPDEAKHWNLLTGWTPDALRYAA